MKKTSLRSPGLVDLHFHGAFGIDLMTAPQSAMNELSDRLWERGIAAFCATTLSVSKPELLEAVGRIGPWIRNGKPRGARPLGIHLEGPFISPEACGAHPPEAIRALDFTELDQLWEASLKTLKLITIAPEILKGTQLKDLVRWAKPKRVTLAIGHSKASERVAREAFEAGFSGVTHAWNALNFHHRTPGVLGAAFGRPKTHVELIIDQVHVALATLRMTRKAHPEGVCFVSDCVPAAATAAETWHSFGHLKVRLMHGACRLPDGHLAGGGKLLTEAYADWLVSESAATRVALPELFKKSIEAATLAPLRALGLTPKAIAGRRIQWILSGKSSPKCSPIQG